MVKSIAECSPWSILQYFWHALSDNWFWNPIFSLFGSGRFTQVLLYCQISFTINKKIEKAKTIIVSWSAFPKQLLNGWWNEPAISGWSVAYIDGSHVIISQNFVHVLLSLKIEFVLASSVDKVTFHLCLRCMQSARLGVTSLQTVRILDKSIFLHESERYWWVKGQQRGWGQFRLHSIWSKDIIRGMWFSTMWHFDKCRLRRASAVSF